LASNETLSIASEYSGMMQRHWKCSNCAKEFIFNLKERMQHEVTCQMNSKKEKKTNKVIHNILYFYFNLR